MNYITDFHWAWYGFGFLLCPRLTIMICLTLHFGEFIPPLLMFIGWVFAILSCFGGSKKENK